MNAAILTIVSISVLGCAPSSEAYDAMGFSGKSRASSYERCMDRDYPIVTYKKYDRPLDCWVFIMKPKPIAIKSASSAHGEGTANPGDPVKNTTTPTPRPEAPAVESSEITPDGPKATYEGTDQNGKIHGESSEITKDGPVAKKW